MELEHEFRGPYRWEIDMTLCIAAITNGFEPPIVPRIAFCADWKTASPQGSSETTLKIRGIGRGWYCLAAGSMIAVPTIHKMLKAKLRSIAVDEVTLRPALCDVVESYKKQLTQEFTSTKLAMSLEEFKSTGKDRLPNDLHNAAWRQITEIKIGAEFIIMGFIGDEPILCKIEDDGRVSYREQYATIGEGAPLAMTSLLQRAQREADTLSETLYKIYEAKKYAETLPSVGSYATALGFLEKDRRICHLPHGKEAPLAQLYEKYGPKRLPTAAVMQLDIDAIFPRQTEA